MLRYRTSMRLIFLVFFFVLSVPFAGFGQESGQFEKIILGNQYDYSVVYALAEDQYGRIWVATEEGVVKYNSQEGRLYNDYDGLPKSFGNFIKVSFYV